MLTVSFLTQLDSGILFHCCIQETCGAVILVWVPKKSPSPPKKMSSTLPKSFFFIKQIIKSFLLWEIYQKQDILEAYL